MDSTKGGLLVGHTDKEGGKGITVLAPEGQIRMGGGESVINEQATKENCELLSKINQSTGGVEIPCNVEGNIDTKETPKQMLYGGEIPSAPNYNKLEVAKELIKTHSVKQVWEQTGWIFTESDKKWKFEIPDQDAKFKKSLTELLDIYNNENKCVHILSDIFEHPILYNLYPESKDILLAITEAPRQEQTIFGEAFLNKENKYVIVLTINFQLYGNIRNSHEGRSKLHAIGREVLTHELQHFLQLKHQFGKARGVQEIKAGIKRHVAEIRHRSTSITNPKDKSKLLQLIEFYELNLDTYANEVYWNQNAEVEARDAQDRFNLSEFDRKEKVPDIITIQKMETGGTVEDKIKAMANARSVSIEYFKNKHTMKTENKNNITLYTKLKGEGTFKASDTHGHQVSNLVYAPRIHPDKFEDFKKAVQSVAKENPNIIFQIRELVTNKVLFDSEKEIEKSTINADEMEHTYENLKSCLINEGGDENIYLFEGKEFVTNETGKNERWTITGFFKYGIIATHLPKNQLHDKKSDRKLTFDELKQLYINDDISIDGVDSKKMLEHCTALLIKCIDLIDAKEYLHKEKFEHEETKKKIEEVTPVFVNEMTGIKVRNTYDHEHFGTVEVISIESNTGDKKHKIPYLVTMKLSNDKLETQGIDGFVKATTPKGPNKEEETHSEIIRQEEAVNAATVLENTELSEAIELITDLCKTLKGKEKKECQEALVLLNEMLPKTMASGGVIPNNYIGKTSREVWDLWTAPQRRHFLMDHKHDFKGLEVMNHGPSMWNDYSVDKGIESKFEDLPFGIREELSFHIIDGQYDKGGKIPEIEILGYHFTKDGFNTGDINFKYNGEEYRLGMQETHAGNTPYGISKIGSGYFIFLNSREDKYNRFGKMYTSIEPELKKWMISNPEANDSNLFHLINHQIEQHKINPNYDEDGAEINKVYELFNKECFVIDENEEASKYILGATPIEALEYLKNKVEENRAGNIMEGGGVITDSTGGIDEGTEKTLAAGGIIPEEWNTRTADDFEIGTPAVYKGRSGEVVWRDGKKAIALYKDEKYSGDGERLVHPWWSIVTKFGEPERSMASTEKKN